MLQLKVKITKVEKVEREDRYGQFSVGYTIIGVEQDVPEGEWQNKVTWYTRDSNIQVGDVGMIQCNLDINQKGYMQCSFLRWNPTEVTGY